MRSVLVIDDDAAIRAVVSDILGDEGYTVETAPDGVTGLQRLVERQPDMILLDERMPHIPGHRIAQLLHVDPRTSAIPIVMMSAHSYDVMPGLPNCLLFLRKPFRLVDLVTAVEDVIGRPDAPIFTSS